MVYYNPVAVQLHWIKATEHNLIVMFRWLRLEAYSEEKHDKSADFAPIEIVQDLVPKNDYSRPIEECPIWIVQQDFGVVASGLGYHYPALWLVDRH
jgi:hypothetical protein